MYSEEDKLKLHVSELTITLQHLEHTYLENSKNQEALDYIDFYLNNAINRLKIFMHETRIKNNTTNQKSASKEAEVEEYSPEILKMYEIFKFPKQR